MGTKYLLRHEFETRIGIEWLGYAILCYAMLSTIQSVPTTLGI